MQARIRIVLLAVFVLGLIVLPAARGAVRLGPDLTTVQDGLGYGCQPGSYSPCTYINLRSTNPDVPVAAAANGVITTWRFRAGCCTDKQTESRTMTLGTFKQGTQDGLSGYAYVIPVAKGPSFVIPPGNQVLSDPEVELPARMPIAAGERIGIIADHPIAFASYAVPDVTLSIITTGTVYNGEPYGVAYGGAMAINADVEPDADGDGYGDETQDCQPANPAAHEGNCGPPPVFIPPGPIGVYKPGPCEGICGGGGIVFSSPPQSISTPRGDGGIVIPLECPPTAVNPCGGILYAELPGGKKPRAAASAAKAPKVLARASYSVAPGKKKNVKLVFSKKTREFLALKRSRRVIVTVVPKDGQPISTTKTLKFPAPKG